MLFLKDTAVVGHSESNLAELIMDSTLDPDESNVTISESQQDVEVETISGGEGRSEPQPGTSSNGETTSTPVRYYDGCPQRKKRKTNNTGEDVIKTVASALQTKCQQQESITFQVGKLVDSTMRALSPDNANEFLKSIFSLISEFSTREKETFFK